MLSHFKEVKEGTKPKVRYLIYGCYRSGQDKLILPINIDLLKNKFLTYKINGIKKQHHFELNLSDTDLREFINLLEININANDYDNQLRNIFELLKTHFVCDDFDAEYYYYNNALNEIKKIAIQPNKNDRKISKKEFIENINHKTILFNKWFLELKGEKQYFKEIKNRYFTKLNKEPFVRIFLIELPSTYNKNDLKDLVFLVSKKFSNLSKREPKPFCPYIHFYNIKENDLIDLKTELQNENFNFIDGFAFYGAEFSPKQITLRANNSNQIKIKLINELSHIEDILNFLSARTKEVYQFYLTNKFFSASIRSVKQVNIQIRQIASIKGLL